MQYDLNPFLIFTLAVGASMLLIPVIGRLAPRLGLLDQPDARKVHKAPVPRVGGWGITLGIVLPLLIALPLDPASRSLVIGVLVLFAFGVWDDACCLGHWTKFAGQIGAVSVVVWYGDVWVSRLPFDVILDPIAGKAFTTFALVGAVNAINHSDGLDGLAGGETVLSLIAIAVLGYVVADVLVVGVALATIGGILGFLRYNSHPARVFMGDAGSQVLGFTLGFLVVYLTQVTHTALGAALPLLLLGLPIVDILAVLYQRMRARGNWFTATRNHVHHRLLELGFDHYETVVVIYTIQACFVVSAVLLRYESDVTILATYAGLVVSTFAALIGAERRGWRPPRNFNTPFGFAALLRRLRDGPWLRDVPLAAISVLVPSFLLLGPLRVATVPGDFAIMAGVLAAVIAVEMLRAPAVGSVVGRASIYATAIFSAYLLIDYSAPAQAPLALAVLLALGVLAIATLVYVRFASARHEFGTTPTDYLIVVGVVALTVFGGVDAESRSLVELVAYATVLLYACEVVITVARRLHLLQASTLVALTIMVVRGAGAAF